MINSPKPQLIVVLGMHRSGSSAITRSLVSLGFDLGSHLMEPSLEMNEKGFFEDVEFCRLNEKVLDAVNSSWSSLDPIDSDLFNLDSLEPLRQEAEILLRNRLENSPFFGVKDPRFSILLPFWKPVFKSIGLQARYILASRNPADVAGSLRARDNFADTKSYILWLDHMVSSLRETTAESVLVVGYDKLIESPYSELERMARFLEVPYDPAGPAVREYAEEFLEGRLRHWKSPKSLSPEDPNLPPGLLDLYRLLLKLGADEIRPGDKEVESVIERVSRIQKELRPALRYAQTLEIETRTLKKELQQRSDSISERDLKLTETGRQVEKLNQRLAESVEERRRLEHDLESIQNGMWALEATLQDKNAELEEAAQLNYRTALHVRQILDSRSWRITEPMRRLGRLYRSCRLRSSPRQ